MNFRHANGTSIAAEHGTGVTNTLATPKWSQTTRVVTPLDQHQKPASFSLIDSKQPAWFEAISKSEVRTVSGCTAGSTGFCFFSW